MFRLPSLALVLCLAAGCAGYRLGPTNGDTAGARSIQVNFFQNKTLEPRLSAPVNQALRKAIQQDGTYRLNTREDGDLVVNGEITRFDRSGVSFQPTDVITVRDYELSLTARVIVTERSTGRVVLDLGSAERQALPLIAEDLARNTTSLLVDGAW
jgi:hypothetical protein